MPVITVGRDKLFEALGKQYSEQPTARIAYRKASMFAIFGDES